MWKFTLFFNIFILALFWMLAMVAITPAHNNLVQYAEIVGVLPILTDQAIQARSIIGLIPLSWAVLTLFWGRQTDYKRNAHVAAHTSVTVLLGLVLFFFYALAGILPILKIGATLS